MTRSTSSFTSFSVLLRRNWLILVLFLFVGLSLTVDAPAWAANKANERNQTVPGLPPTPTPAPPTPTPKKDKEDDPPPPTPTPQPNQGAPQQPPTAPTLSGVVVPEAINVRSGPGTSFPVIGRLVANDQVKILFRDQVGAWWQICCGQPSGERGWVSASLIRPDFDPAQANQLIPIAPNLPVAPTPTVAAGTPVTTTPASGDLQAVVNADRLNMRSGPGTDFEVVAKLTRNQIVSVAARNERGDWWFVCCGGEEPTQGWVSAPYLTPTFDSGAALQLIPLYSASTPDIAGTQAITASAATTLTVDVATPTTAALAADMALRPPFALQGQRAQIVITVTNTTPVTATNVTARNELHPSLVLIEATTENGSVAQETTESGATVVVFRWSALAPNDAAVALITVAIAPDLPDGSVLDNLAAVSAENAADVTTGMFISMPPTAPPDFR